MYFLKAINLTKQKHKAFGTGYLQTQALHLLLMKLCTSQLIYLGSVSKYTNKVK